MPASRITTNFEFGPNRDAFIADYHAVLREHLKIGEHDRLVILDEHTDGFYQPTDTSGNYAFVEISLFVGRDTDTKRALYKGLAELFERYDVPAANARFALYEAPRENWGVRSGQAGCDIEYRI